MHWERCRVDGKQMKSQTSAVNVTMHLLLLNEDIIAEHAGDYIVMNVLDSNCSSLVSACFQMKMLQFPRGVAIHVLVN